MAVSTDERLDMNTFMVGAQDGTVRILNVPAVLKGLTGAEAVNLAAWLVAVSEPMPGGGRDAFETAYLLAISS
jgi:hypothetical protein